MNIVEYKNVLDSMDIDSMLVRSVEIAEPDIVSVLTEQHLHGLDKSGAKIKPDYKSDLYAAIKKAQNPQPGLGTPDLHRSGEMHRTMSMIVKGTRVTFESTVGYFKYLEKRYRKAFGVYKTEDVWEFTTFNFINLFKKAYDKLR